MLSHHFRVSPNDFIKMENNGALDTTWSMTVLMWFFNDHGHTAPLIQYGLNIDAEWGPNLEYEDVGGHESLSVGYILHIFVYSKRNISRNLMFFFLKELR